MSEAELQQWWEGLGRSRQGEILDHMYVNGETEETIDRAELIWSRWDMGLPLKPSHLQHLRGWAMAMKKEEVTV